MAIPGWKSESELTIIEISLLWAKITESLKSNFSDLMMAFLPFPSRIINSPRALLIAVPKISFPLSWIPPLYLTFPSKKGRVILFSYDVNSSEFFVFCWILFLGLYLNVPGIESGKRFGKISLALGVQKSPWSTRKLKSTNFI